MALWDLIKRPFGTTRKVAEAVTDAVDPIGIVSGPVELVSEVISPITDLADDAVSAVLSIFD